GGGRANGPGGRVAARHRAGAVPRGRAAPQEAPGAGPVDAGSPRGRAQEAGARRSAQAVPVLEEIETSSHTLPDPMPGPYGVAPEMTAAADRTQERKGMAQPQLQDLLEAGVHFGHQTRRWNPKMRRFIFAERSGIYIIDLQKTLRQIEAAQELLLFERERLKLEKYLSGIKNMGRLPGALFIVDSKKERIAVAEANKLGIPVVAIVDTNADPDLITVPIPGNDDAIRAVSLITAALSDIIGEARRQSPLREATEEGEAVTYSTETGVEAEAEGDTHKKPARRKRRPKPEAIAARLKTEDAPAASEPSGGAEG